MVFVACTPSLASAAIMACVGGVTSVWGNIFAAAGFGLVVLVMLLDTAARWREYKKVKDVLAYGSQRELDVLRGLMQGSWCQRHAFVAALHAYNRDIGEDHYYNLGYRWYHLLPNGFLSTKSPLFSWRWWAALLGIKLQKGLR